MYQYNIKISNICVIKINYLIFRKHKVKKTLKSTFLIISFQNESYGKILYWCTSKTSKLEQMSL